MLRQGRLNLQSGPEAVRDKIEAARRMDVQIAEQFMRESRSHLGLQAEWARLVLEREKALAPRAGKA